MTAVGLEKKEFALFVITLTYKKAIEEVEKHLAGHIQYFEKYYAEKVFLASGRKVPRTGGVILANCESKEMMEKIVSEDPFFQAGVANFDIVEFVPTMTSDDLAILKTFV